MMNIAVLDGSTLGKDLDLSVLSAYGNVSVYENVKGGEIRSALRNADVAVLNKVRINEETAGDPDRLRLIAVAATGYDNVDLDYCRRHGIGVANVRGYSTDAVAQLTMTMALTLITHLPTYRRYTADGSYTAGGKANCLVPVYHELAGKTWGIVGLGAIGKRVAALAGAFGCRIVAVKRTPDPQYTCVDLPTLCRTADIISVHTPLTDETRGLFGERELSLMKPGTLFLNLARGAVTDEEAVVRALESGKLGGIGIDVYTAEPFPATSPYCRVAGRDDVILTPHIAWGAYETRVRLLREIAENIAAFQRGEKRNRVD